MKKLFFALVAALLIAMAFAPNVALAEDVDQDFTQNSEIYDFVQELCDYNYKGVEYARAYLEDKFAETLDGKGAVSKQQFENGQYVNLVAKLTKNGADKQIIIGAHYDTFGEGAGDNACGVAALYRAMQLLSSNVGKLPCNVVFVAFDGEEAGLLGSEYYVNKMSQAERDSTLVMFNVDTIATGDKLYLHCENKSTDLAKLILGNAEGLQHKPYAKGTFGIAYDVYGYGYYETVQGSDHTPFRLAGIPTALFFSGTYSSTVWNYAENSDPSKAVMNSTSDTFENLTLNHPNFDARIEAVAQAIVNTVTDANFATVGANARKQLVNLNFWYNVWWPIITVVVIAIAAIVLAIFYYRKLQKNAILGESEIKSQTVFEKPDADDIFSFKSDDTDDIFTFKK